VPVSGRLGRGVGYSTADAEYVRVRAVDGRSTHATSAVIVTVWFPAKLNAVGVASGEAGGPLLQPAIINSTHGKATAVQARARGVLRRVTAIAVAMVSPARRGSGFLGEPGRLGRRGSDATHRQLASRLAHMPVEPERACRAAVEPRDPLLRLAGTSTRWSHQVRSGNLPSSNTSDGGSRLGAHQSGPLARFPGQRRSATPCR
jgi:hypothetical protein